VAERRPLERFHICLHVGRRTRPVATGAAPVYRYTKEVEAASSVFHTPFTAAFHTENRFIAAV